MSLGRRRSACGCQPAMLTVRRRSRQALPRGGASPASPMARREGGKRLALWMLVLAQPSEDFHHLVRNSALLFIPANPLRRSDRRFRASRLTPR